MRLADLRRNNLKSIRAAGPRYGPGLDSHAPNLSIAGLNRVFDAIGLTPQFRLTIRQLRVEFEGAWGKAPGEVVRGFRRRIHDPRLLVSRLVDLELVTPQSAGDVVRRVRITADRIDAVVRRLLSEAQNRFRAAPTDDEEKRKRAAEYDQVLRFASAVRIVIDFIRDPSADLICTNTMLLLGEWGMGKTHSLCDLTQRRMDQKLPTLLYLAQQLPPDSNPLEGLCRITGLASNTAALLAALDRLGRQGRTRALIIIDAINEGDRVAWRQALSALCREVRRYPNIGMVLSCRQPFETQIVGARSAKQLIFVYHQGFSGIEFDAQLSFFQYYNIPAPQVPLITPEYSRPLFLRLLCKAITNLSTGKMHRQIRSFASGQKGMTYLLEYFATQIGAAIEHEFGLPRKTCWRILKGDATFPGGPIVGIASLMADRLREYITWDEYLGAIEPFVSRLQRHTVRRLARRMLVEGLLAEELRWEENGYQEVIRFPYQRFGDHIIARSLLRHLNTTSPTAIRRSFYRTRPLGRVFEIVEGQTSFLRPGFASAIMLEFPERVKDHVPHGEIELIFYLPKRKRLMMAFKEAFLEGLAWRSAEHFTSVTGNLIALLIERYDEYTRNETFEVLVGLASRPGHPFSSERLHRYLASLPMADRDLFWTEYLRNADDVSVVFKLIEWVERNAAGGLHAETVDVMIRLLSLILTTTRRPLRDRATRALFLIGLKHPRSLFTIALSFLAFNDTYVPERLLAASYGVAMSLWADPGGGMMRTALTPFVNELVMKLFVPGAPHATRHVLMRDYALNLIALARRLDPTGVPKRNLKYVRAPFAHLPVQLPVPEALTQEQRAGTEPALHMDFDNYTLGHLIPGRRNYDSQNQEYQLARNRLLGRMSQLGYEYSRFKQIDHYIDSNNWYRANDGNKTDRYGKKYSWIAYFELYGLRQDHGQIRDSPRPPFQRMSGCDIDPSFPEAAWLWKPTLPDVFRDAPHEAVEWLQEGPVPRYDHLLQRTSVGGLQGPWVLLNGFIDQTASGDSREVFTFLRGLLSPENRVDRLRRTLENTQYPGNDAIPRPYEDVYTFAGELPWSPNFGGYLRSQNGGAKRNIQSAFERWGPGRRRWGLPVEVPVHEFGWESYHSTMNQAGGAEVPAPALCELLGLANRPRTFDLYDASGRQVTICRSIQEGGRGRLLYIRTSSLRHYLQATHQTLVWILWGERNFSGGSGMHDRADVRSVFPEYRHIHKRFITSGL